VELLASLFDPVTRARSAETLSSRSLIVSSAFPPQLYPSSRITTSPEIPPIPLPCPRRRTLKCATISWVPSLLTRPRQLPFFPVSSAQGLGVLRTFRSTIFSPFDFQQISVFRSFRTGTSFKMVFPNKTRHGTKVSVLTDWSILFGMPLPLFLL